MNIKFGQYIEATALTADKLHFTENKWLLMTEKKPLYNNMKMMCHLITSKQINC